MLIRFNKLTTIAEREDARDRLRQIIDHYYDISLQIANLWAEHLKDPEMEKECQTLRIANDDMVEQVDKVISMLTENNDNESVQNTGPF